MDYEKAYKETLDNLQVMVNEGKITENVAKKICSDFKLESENERIRKEILRIVDTWTATCFKVNGIPREDLLAWVEKKDTKNTTELPNGEDYGIDGMSAAIDILKKTLGKVEGYQSDDGILEHKCAISAVKELSKKEQKPAEWTDEDDEMVEDIIDSIPSIYAVSDYNEMVGWLKEVKKRVKHQEKH